MKLFNSILKPSESVMTSLATAGLVYGVYQLEMPTVTEVHGAEPHNGSVDSSRKKAMWTSAAVVGGAFLITHDANVFTAGSIMFLALEWSYRHANATHSGTGKLVPYTANQALDMGYVQSGEEEDNEPDETGYGDYYG